MIIITTRVLRVPTQVPPLRRAGGVQETLLTRILCVQLASYVSRSNQLQLRTTIRLDPATGLPVRKTVHKRLLKVRDFCYVPTLGAGKHAKESLRVLSSDVRVALSEERVLESSTLPPWGSRRASMRVRIKQRRSFLYTPEGAEEPVWRFDFTLVWAGKTFAQAHQRQQFEEPDFELECELLDPLSHLAMQVSARVPIAPSCFLTKPTVTSLASHLYLFARALPPSLPLSPFLSLPLFHSLPFSPSALDCGSRVTARDDL